MEKISEKCALILEVLTDRGNLYAPECIAKMEKEAKQYQIEIDSFLTVDYLKECMKDKEMRSVLHYVIYCREDLVESMKEEVIDYLILSYPREYSEVFLHILMLEMPLSDEIVLKVMGSINQDCSRYSPFDWRYHILKRKEISDDVKKEVMKTYQKPIPSICEEIKNDLQSEFMNKEIHNKEELSSYPILEDELRAYKTLKNFRKEYQKVYE